MYVVTLSFDDGLEPSSLKTVEILERFGLSAAINVVARGHLGEPEEAWHSRWRKGDFGLWNELRARGHEIMPHGYRHADKAKLPLEESKRLIEACLASSPASSTGSARPEPGSRFPTTPRGPRSRRGPYAATVARTVARAFQALDFGSTMRPHTRGQAPS